MLLEISVAPTDFAIVMQKAWELMCTEFTIYGLTTSFGAFYLFSLLCSIILFALFHFLWR